ncbi:hypothetical protein [Piscirickettsia salmonis]|uniref:hypothetical protein n=1 Tax=Piscirickettsia salmonis TaxID=1238 RepID=UPI001013D4EF|nr:hypothetical protein [Piscirickettsia salmonis]QNR82284.1 hypothetical protein ICC15_17425 [Piscirickettsia salmonis]WGZ73232.1 hypothetical protein E3220_16675 [Piscirickettsia salmonis]
MPCTPWLAASEEMEKEIFSKDAFSKEVQLNHTVARLSVCFDHFFLEIGHIFITPAIISLI